MTLDQLAACCGSFKWAEAMYSQQPFANSVAMHEAADEIWWSLTVDDWLEAFSKHPKIGDKSGEKWSAEEQSGMSKATADAAQQMALLNADYCNKFGFIFIVCAMNKSADEMLGLIKERIGNSRDEEIRIAAAEQGKITHLRLDRLGTV